MTAYYASRSPTQEQVSSKVDVSVGGGVGLSNIRLRLAALEGVVALDSRSVATRRTA
jgi:hypothetical protein